MHWKWAIAVGLPYVPEVERIIDTLYHDVGRRSVIVTVVPPIDYIDKVGATALLDLLRDAFGDPVPDEILRVAALHHFLDQMEKELKGLGASVAERCPPEKILEWAHGALRRCLGEQRYRGGTGWVLGDPRKIEEDIRLLERALEDVRSLLVPHMGGIRRDLLNWLKERGAREIGLGYAESVVWTLIEGAFRPGAKKFVCVDGRWLPLRAAARKIASSLLKGTEVEVRFEGKKGIVRIEARSLGEFYERLRGEI